MPGGRVTPDRGFPPHIPHLRARVSRDRGRCFATPSLGQGETLSCGSLTACPSGLSLGRHTAGDRRVHRAGEPSGQSHKAVTASGDWGFDPLCRHSCRHREDDPVGRYRVLPASGVVRGPHPRGGILIFPVPASRGGMASSTAPDASAAMAVDREAEGAGALFGPEEDIDDDVLANLLSASCRPCGGSRAPFGPCLIGLRPSRPAPSLLGEGFTSGLRVALGQSTRATSSGLPSWGWRWDDRYSGGTPGPPSGAPSSLYLGWAGPVWYPFPCQPGHMVELGAFPWGTPVHSQ